MTNEDLYVIMCFVNADMAELVDASDLGSDVDSCRFESCYPHQKNNEAIASLFFIQAAGLVWNHALACMALPKAYGITEGASLLRLDSIRLLCNQFHSATSSGFHAQLRRD